MPQRRVEQGLGLVVALAALSACTWGTGARSEVEASSKTPQQFGDEVHIDVPVSLTAIWALRAAGSSVTVVRKRHAPTGGGGGHYNVFAVFMLLIPGEAYDIATVVRDGQVTYRAEFEANGRFVHAEKNEGGRQRTFARLTLAALGKSLLVETTPQGFVLEPRAYLLEQYAEALDAPGIGPDLRGTLYQEAFEALAELAAPIAKRLEGRSEPDEVLAHLIAERCLHADAPLCAHLFAAALARGELGSAAAALAADHFVEPHRPPACAPERIAELTGHLGRYAFAGAAQLNAVTRAFCEGPEAFDVAARRLGVTPITELPSGRVNAPVAPYAPADAPLVQVVIREACRDEQLETAVRVLHEQVRPWAERQQLFERRPEADCTPARWEVVLHHAGVFWQSQPVEKALVREGARAAAWVRTLDARDAVARTLLLRMLERQPGLESPELEALAAATRSGNDRDFTLTAAEAAVVTQAYLRLERCRVAGRCAQDLVAHTNALTVLGAFDERRTAALPLALAKAMSAAVGAARSPADRALAAAPFLLWGHREHESTVAGGLGEPGDARDALLRHALRLGGCTEDESRAAHPPDAGVDGGQLCSHDE